MNIIIGRVTKDIEINTTPNGAKYASFDVAEKIGYGDKETTQFHQCTIWGEENVNRITNAKVQKGSLLHIVGQQKIEPYMSKQDNQPKAASNIRVIEWSYVPVSGKKNDETKIAEPGTVYTDAPTENCQDDLPM